MTDRKKEEEVWDEYEALDTQEDPYSGHNQQGKHWKRQKL
jgi:hypothetical protein